MIIPVFRVIQTSIPTNSDTGDVEAGMLVGLSTDGYLDKYTTGDTYYPLGLAGDRKRSSEAYEWVNRVSDSGDETAAAGRMTVYHGGGEFYVDVDDSAITTPGGTEIDGIIDDTDGVAGDYLYPSATAGHLTTTQSNSDAAVAQIIETAASLDSGIPGEYEPGSSVEYVDDSTPRTWYRIKLLI